MIDPFFFFNILIFLIHEIFPHMHLRMCKLGFLVTNMLLQTIKFGNKQCITTFHNNANLAPYHIQPTIFLDHSFCPWQFCCPNILECSIQLPWILFSSSFMCRALARGTSIR
jgi:hypothetical protein